MDKKRLETAAMSGRGASGRFRLGTGGGRPERRLRAQMLLLITIVVVWIVLPDDRDEDLKPTVAEPPSFDVPVVREPIAEVDPARLADVADATPVDRTIIERGALEHLLEEAGKLVWGDLELMGLRAVPWETLTSEPAAHRGEPVYAVGRLQWLEIDEDDPLLAHVHGELHDADGRPWRFVVLTQLYGLDVGDVVKVEGFFLKHHRWRGPDGEFVSGPLLVGEEILQSSFRMEPVADLSPELLASVRDYDLESASRPLESPQFYSFLSYVEHADADTLLAGDPERRDHRADELLQHPQIARGQVVRVSGTLLEKTRRLLGPRGENPLGISHLWYLYLHRAGGVSLAVSVDAPDGLEVGDIVDVDGVFFRRYAFENRRNAPVSAAVVIAKRLAQFVPPEDTLTPALGAIVLGITALGLAVIVMGSRNANREAAEARRRRVARKKRQLAANLSTPTGAAPDPRPNEGGAAAPGGPAPEAS